MSILEGRSVIIGQQTFEKLNALLKRLGSNEFRSLEDELDSASIVADAIVAEDVVTMNSVVTFEDIHSGTISTVKLVYPGDAATDVQSVSILAPVGAALIGLREGEVIVWPLPKGRKAELKVLKVRHDG